MNSYLQFHFFNIFVVGEGLFTLFLEVVRKEFVFEQRHHCFRVDQEQSGKSAG